MTELLFNDEFFIIFSRFDPVSVLIGFELIRP